jgi:phospholipid transport system substrate-binding protein
MKRKLHWLLALAFLVSPVYAQESPAPDVLIKRISQEVTGMIKGDKEIQAGNPKKIAELVEGKILPHFEFTRMTQTAMGRNWRVANPEQQKALTQEFRTLLVRTYSTALSSYRDQIIDVKPLRAAPADNEVTVKSEVKQPGGQPLAVEYDLEKTPAGWKIYDIKVGGVSLVTTYRETFSAEIRERGVDGLIKTLAAKNRQNETKAGAGRT